MKKFDLQKEIHYITGEIIKKYNPQRIILFGSASEDKFTPDSDLDLLIIKDDPQPSAERTYAVSGMFEHNVATDILVYSPDEIKQSLKWGDPFIKQILTFGKVLYG